MICEVYREVGQTNQVIPDVVKIEDANNQITITDAYGTETIITNDTYYEIVGTPDYT